MLSIDEGNAGIQKKIETGWQLSFSGQLLTERQQVLKEDMSLAEIAQQEGVNRGACTVFCKNHAYELRFAFFEYMMLTSNFAATAIAK